MGLEIITTADGSPSLRNTDLDEIYHSIHGALSESRHVYIQAGFDQVQKNPVRVLEVGFGTGLNFLLTLAEAEKKGRSVTYEALEPFPIDLAMAERLNLERFGFSSYIITTVHSAPDGEFNFINLTLRKLRKSLQHYEPANKFDLIYFDAFGPRVQPELWQEEVFRKLYSLLNPDGFLVTYCAKGGVKRAMKAAGLRVESLPGPPGKREMVRAWR